MHPQGRPGYGEMTHVEVKMKRCAFSPYTDAAMQGHIDPVILLLEGPTRISPHRMMGQRHYIGQFNIAILTSSTFWLKSGPAFTPLHLAAQEGYLDVVQLLVESACDIDRATQSGATALDVASECGHSKVVPRNFARKIHWEIGTSGWHSANDWDSVALASTHDFVLAPPFQQIFIILVSSELNWQFWGIVNFWTHLCGYPKKWLPRVPR